MEKLNYKKIIKLQINKHIFKHNLNFKFFIYAHSARKHLYIG